MRRTLVREIWRKPAPADFSILLEIWRSFRRRASTLATLAVLLASVACAPIDPGPIQVQREGADGLSFVANDTCAECHQQQFEEWNDSHHDAAMRHADASSVLGDFGDATFTQFGVESRFFQEDGRYYVTTEGADGELAQFEVKYTFGVEPLQQYLIGFPGGRLQSLSIAWDVENKRWFHLYPDERISADDPLHWTGRLQNWNMMCAECHSTNLQKNYNADTDTYATTWSEINVSCQACHGPGKAHVDWAQSLPEGVNPNTDERGLVVNFTGADPRYEVDSCARCHSRRHQVSASDQHGRPLLDDFLVATLREDLYHADGQILDEVYVYGSFVQSKMYHEGVRCSDCHSPHSLEPYRQGNDLCTRCHQMVPPEEFPDLQAKSYDTPEHHFHPQDSTGAQCVECHMPASTYMVVDPRRDHSMRVPRPDLSVKLGTPNACNDCHEDETPAWATAAADRWYGPERQPHFAAVIAAGRQALPGAQDSLLELAKDVEQPAIARATALDLLLGYASNDLADLQPLTDDASPVVRTRAVAALQGIPPDQSVEALGAMLDDPVRAVRIEAARVLASVPRSLHVLIDREAYRAAFAEFEEAQYEMADTPGAQLNLGAAYAGQGNVSLAEERYVAAIRLQPSFLPARMNLATLYNQRGRNAEAEELLRESVRIAPQEGEVHYSLGLLLAEEQRMEEAAASLQQAAQLLPERARVQYNYGLALQFLNQRPGAEAQLLRAHDLDPTDPAILSAVTTFYLQDQNLGEAIRYAERFAQLFPDSPEAEQLVSRLRAQLAGE